MEISKKLYVDAIRVSAYLAISIFPRLTSSREYPFNIPSDLVF